MRLIVVSDFHLKYDENTEDHQRCEKVLSFLVSLIGCTDMLVLNGDIFDLWYTWKRVIIKDYFQVLRTLADIHDSGCRIVITAGNHDFWFRDFLEGEIGIEIYPDFLSEIIDRKKAFFAHGDVYTSSDTRYQIYRSLIRRRWVMKIFEFFHPDFSLKIGKQWSRSSRGHKRPSASQQRKEAGLNKKARELIESGYDMVFFGHSHQPHIESYMHGYYLNSGDWLQHNSYLEVIDGKPELKIYKNKGELND
ncbi:MAG: UDP-2,3-diacylglucosamine diphosphatase [Candidatus Cloacimonetes bacterium]|nr:UDP-2,3-diacylglucosamine diphosphatase [Candidatus Cloacimonadota bacterium]